MLNLSLPGTFTKPLYLSWLILILNGCTVTIPDIKLCSVAGQLSAGADCATTISNKTESLTLDQFIVFLEPQLDRPDPNDPTKTLPARGGALCQSSEDWTKMKTAFQQACKLLGAKCTKETQAAFEAVTTRAEALQSSGLDKRRKRFARPH